MEKKVGAIVSFPQPEYNVVTSPAGVLLPTLSAVHKVFGALPAAEEVVHVVAYRE